MRIGVTTIYAHRPSIYFAGYLAKLLNKNGDEVSSLVCDASLPTCYSILSKNTRKLSECPKCMAGGLRSYDIASYYSIDKKRKSSLSAAEVDEIVLSSVMTLERAEVPEHINHDNITPQKLESLKEAVSIVYQNTLDWISRDNLELVVCYNGRMDVTRAIIAACESAGVKYMTLERPIYGYGIQLIPDANCLSLSERVRFNKEFRDVELSENEKVIANWLAEMRVSQKSHLEWRTYKLNESTDSNQFDFPQVIILPSSGCEFYGNDDWKSSWGHFTNALNHFLERTEYDRNRIAIKMHPVWNETIGYKGGEHITEFYRSWAYDKGVRVIETSDPVSSNLLIRESELVVVGGSSAGVDAALMGKKVLLMGRSHYEGGGFVCQVRDDDEWQNLDMLENLQESEIITKAKRYLYTATFRFYPLSDKVIPLDYFRYRFADDSLEFLYLMAKNGRLRPWQVNFTDYDAAEDLRENGKLLFGGKKKYKEIPVKRRFMFRSIDRIRMLFPRGDQVKRKTK